MKTDKANAKNLLLQEMTKKIKNIFLTILFLFLSDATVNAQAKKNVSETFEYQSALYNAVSQEVYISMKNNVGAVKQFLYKLADDSQTETILFNPINSLQGNSNVLTKSELIGNKYTITFIPLHGSAPEGVCCFKITACVPE